MAFAHLPPAIKCDEALGFLLVQLFILSNYIRIDPVFKSVELPMEKNKADPLCFKKNATFECYQYLSL